MVIEILADGGRVRVDGVEYVRADAAGGEPAPGEPYMLLAHLCREYRVDKHAAYDAVRAGALDARMPKGRVRGLLCRRSEFERWRNERHLVRWEA